MDDIAIVGMSCIFPSAGNLREYWQNIVNKVDAVSDPPEDWGGEFAFDPDSSENDRIYCKRGGYLGDLARFDPVKYGIMPNSVDGAEPEHFLALRVASDALKDAGFPDIPINRERTEVILGRGTFVNRGYTSLHQHGLFIEQTLDLIKELDLEITSDKLKTLKQQLKAKLPPFNAEIAPGLVSNIMSGRIANRLDLKGANYNIDAACASSLIAVDLGIQNLLSGKCDTVIAGAVQLTTHHLVLMVFCQLGALSRTSRIRPFDKNTDGTLLGEGLGMVVLKRKEDAERDGNRIYAVLKGVGSASDGRAKSVVAPRIEGEELAMRRAYEVAGLSPDTIGLIEAHGTAMPVGDAIEFQAMGRVFGQGNGRSSKCAVGSVKSMIAHLIPASGIAGLIKTALALHHKVLPPTLHCNEPNPELEIEKTPFYLNSETRPWIHDATDFPRRAGVNAFGFGGINAHAVLEEYSPDKESEDLCRNWETELFVFHGDSRKDLIEQCGKVVDYLQRTPVDGLVDLAYSVNSGFNDKACKLSVIASSHDELLKKLVRSVERLSDPKCMRIQDRSGIYFFEKPLGREGDLAFLFPGEGSQYINMLSDLCIHFPEVRKCFDLLDRTFHNHPRNSLPSDFIFPPPNGNNGPGTDAGEDIWRMDVSVDAVITADRALFRLFDLLDIKPNAILGHSSGEIMAIEAAGALELDSDQELMDHILAGNNMIEHLTATSKIPSVVLAAVGGVALNVISAIVEKTPDKLFLAMDNCPNQIVICGSSDIMSGTLDELRKQGAICHTLPFDRPYHTALFSTAREHLGRFFNKLRITAPKIKTYSCMTASPITSDPDEVRRLAVEQWVSPVRFRETIEAMYNDGVRIFVEIGPNANLTGFVNDILMKKPFLATASNIHHRSHTMSR
jgi:acyl transferase domain-containing protein